MKSATRDIHVWAVPKNPDYDDMEGDAFKYELSDSSTYHWKTGAVCIHKESITINIPDNIDFFQKALDTLEAAKVEALAEYTQKIAELDKHIQSLLMLSHQPSDLVGEVVDDYRGADHE